MNNNIFSKLIPIFLFVFTFVIYILTLSRSVYFGDSGEFIAVAKTLGIAHPPGNPLYLMLAHLFTYIPVGNIPFKVNLFSAVTSSLTIVVVYFICLKITANRLASTTASLFLAFSYTFWLYSLVAEVFSLNALFVAIIVLISIYIFDNPTNNKYYYLLALAIGLAISNHHTIVLLIPALIFLYFSSNPRPNFSFKFIISGLFFLFLGLLPYIYIPIRALANPPINWGDPDTLGEFINHFLRKDYGTFSLGIHGVAEKFNLNPYIFYLKTLVSSFTFVGFALGIFGSLYAFKISKRLIYYLLTSLIFTGIFFLLISRTHVDSIAQQAVIERFFIASYVIFAILVGIGLHILFQMVKKNYKFLSLILAVSFLTPLLINFSKADQSSNFLYEEYGKMVFTILPQNSIYLIFSDKGSMMPTYLHEIENKRKDIKIVNFSLVVHPWYQEILKQKYPDLNLPWQNFISRPSAFDIGSVFCQEVSQDYEIFSDTWHDSIVPTENRACFSYPHKILVKVTGDSTELELTKLQDTYNYYVEIEKQLENNKFPDLRSQAILWDYANNASLLGIFLQDLGENDLAKKTWQLALNLHPKYGLASYFAANLEAAENNFDEAIKLAEQSVDLDPNVYLAYKLLGYAYMDEKKDRQMALTNFRKYLIHAPEEEVETDIVRLEKELSNEWITQ